MNTQSYVVLDMLALRRLFPGVAFYEGEPRATDKRGTRYESIGSCGVVEEGALIPAIMNGTKEQALYMFCHQLRKRIGDNLTVVIRQYPTLFENEYRVEDRDGGDDTGHSTRYAVRVKGRFCYYKESL